MSTLTFDGSSSSSAAYGRRVIARRASTAGVKPLAGLPAAQKKEVSLAQVAIGLQEQRQAIHTKKTNTSLVLLSVSIIALHLYGYYWINQPGNKQALAKLSPLTIEIAPPPPPPPVVEKPKPPEPKIVKVVTTKPQPVPENLPVVNTPVETTTPSANTVAVAVAQPPVAVAPAPPPPPEVVTEARGFAGYKNNPAPAYPAVAQRRGLEGTVLLKVHVLASGFADDVKVAKSSGHPILDEAAIKAVLGWTFDPAKRGKTPIDGNVSVPIIFKL